jgi:upstream activation factor subunit UAF30
MSFAGNKQKGGSSGSGSGLLMPLQLSDDLVKFIGTGESMLSRSDVVKRMWSYIKENNLQVLFCSLDIKLWFG